MAGGRWYSAERDRAIIVEAEILVGAQLDDGVLGEFDRSRGRIGCQHRAERRALLKPLAVHREQMPEDHRVGPVD